MTTYAAFGLGRSVPPARFAGPIEAVPYSFEEEVNGRFLHTGSFFHTGGHGRASIAYYDVEVPQRESTYLAQITLTMLAPYGGPFDEADTVFADIDLVDGQRIDTAHGYGGVSGRQFGRRGDPFNQGLSSYLGTINQMIRFRIFVKGDDLVGAVVSVTEL